VKDLLLNVGSGGGAAAAAPSGGAAAGGDAGAAEEKAEEKEEGASIQNASSLNSAKLTLPQRRKNPTTTWDSGSSTKRAYLLFSKLHARPALFLCTSPLRTLRMGRDG
jgi:hypothetical protein